jgi:hypothetical protein
MAFAMPQVCVSVPLLGNADSLLRERQFPNWGTPVSTSGNGWKRQMLVFSFRIFLS